MQDNEDINQPKDCMSLKLVKTITDIKARKKPNHL